jgi:hypothetical protein
LPFSSPCLLFIFCCCLITGWHWNCRTHSPWDFQTGLLERLPFYVVHNLPLGYDYWKHWMSNNSGKIMNYTWFFMQTNMPVEETRKKVWLVDSKVAVQTYWLLAVWSWMLFPHSFYFISICQIFTQIPLQGLIVSSRRESLQHFKKPWAHEHEPVKTLLDAVNVWLSPPPSSSPSELPLPISQAKMS